MMKKLLLFSVLMNGFIFYATAQWSGDAQVADTKVCVDAAVQDHSQMVPDGSGGAIIFWEDSRNGSADIYYNRLDGAGNAVWSTVAAGLSLTNTSVYNSIDHVISDGNGGAFIAWDADDGSNYTQYVQHINNAGTKLWASAGVPLSTTGYSGFVCSDGSGGAIVTWSDYRGDLVNGNPRSYAQRVNSAGSIAWTSGGVQLSSAGGFSAPYGIIADGSGGAIVPIEDTRNSNYDAGNDEYDNIDIYAQRLNSSGNAVWPTVGVPVCTQSGNQIGAGEVQDRYIVSDGAGGAVMGWEDYRNDPNNGNNSPYNEDVFCQRINSSGATQWTAGGVAIASGSNDQYGINLMPDGTGGAVATWLEEAATLKLNAQKINGSGALQWSAGGVAIASESSYFDYHASPDATNTSMLIAWTSNGADIKAEKLSVASGTLLWGGALVCGRSDNESSPAIIYNASSGAIVSWTDDRNSGTTGYDIYANRVLSDGTLPVMLTTFKADRLNDAVSLTWQTSQEVNTSYFDVERSANGTDFSPIGKVMASGNSTTTKNYSFPDNDPNSGINFYRLRIADLDGKSSYSKIVSVSFDGNKNLVEIFPNPVKNTLHVRVTGSSEDARLRITDLSGRRVKEQRVLLNGNTSLSIDINNLPNGTYNLFLKGNSINAQAQFVKE
jgi:hypothetical protein